MKGTYFSVREAAQRVGISRQTMFRHIKTGKVSATIDRDGQKQIEVTELIRVFGELQPETDTPATPRNTVRPVSRDTATPPVTSQYQVEIMRLQAQLEIRTAELELAKERINELKAAQNEVAAEKNRFLDIIERQTLLLAAPKPATPARKRTPAKKPAAASKPTTAAQKRTVTKKPATASVASAKPTTSKSKSRKQAPVATSKVKAATKPSPKAKAASVSKPSKRPSPARKK